MGKKKFVVSVGAGVVKGSRDKGLLPQIFEGSKQKIVKDIVTWIERELREVTNGG